MKLRCIIGVVGLLVLTTVCPRAAEAGPVDADYERVSASMEIPVSVAFQKKSKTLQVIIKAECLPNPSLLPIVTLGLADEKSLMLDSRQVSPRIRRDTAEWTFAVPLKELSVSSGNLQQFRFAGTVEIPGGPYGQARSKMRFRHLDSRAPHAECSTNSTDWASFNLGEYLQRIEDRKETIVLDMDQPLDGKASIIINDSNGKRVRNLISGREFQKGRQSIVWDGLDDEGNVAQPGSYAWKSIHHAGITPHYLFSFCNDGNPPWRTGSGEDMWGPDHSCITTVAALSNEVYFLSPCAESGYQGAVTDLQGIKRNRFGSPTPVSRFLLTTDGQSVFAAADNGKHLVVVRYQPGMGWIPFEKGPKQIDVGDADMNGFAQGDAAFSDADWNAFNLAGVAVAGNKLVVASRAEKGIIVFDAATGARERVISLPEPGDLAAGPDGSFLAVSAGSILRMTPAGDTRILVQAGTIKPGAMTCSRDGKLYVIDNATCQIVIMDAATGRERGRLGVPGGAYAGSYVAERMVKPMDLALADNGWLWVTENRFNPKRVLAWDLKTGKIVKEKFGSTGYGAPGGGFDSDDGTRWVGQGAIWKVDFEKKSAMPQSILFTDAKLMPGAMHWRFIKRDNRTFLFGVNGISSLVEVNPDGSGRVVAKFGCSQGCMSFTKTNQEAFLEAFYKARGFDKPELRQRLHEGKFPHNGEFFLWSDRNGDGVMQAEELEFSDNYGGGYWGSDTENLDLVLLAFKDLGGRPACWRLELPLLGWYPGGAPRWKPLAEALSSARSFESPWYGAEATLADRRGRLFINAEGSLKASGSNRMIEWTYPNKWAGVHGSHNAPLPEQGVLQGALFFLGLAPLDEQSDVMIVNGNHGRFFAFTSDGFYLDECFKDVRMGSPVDAYYIGGECFGGFFARDRKSGNYYLQSGHTDYRLFRIDGFNSVVRGVGGKIEFTARNAEAAERCRAAKQAESNHVGELLVPFLASAPSLGGSGKGWPEIAAKWDKSGKFRVMLQAGYDDRNLYLRYTVEDPSPWINNGEDETLLFKTGDSVDLQLGTDPAANPGRTGSVPGDLRILAAPFKGTNTVVLYRHRVPGARTPVEFSSPWRTEKVDEVKPLPSVVTKVVSDRLANGMPGYTVELVIPFAEMGFTPQAGKKYRADFGVIQGDPSGHINQLRSYWSNRATGLVNDVPGEIMLFPNQWGTLSFEERK